jgi:hypothetical protein
MPTLMRRSHRRHPRVFSDSRGRRWLPSQVEEALSADANKDFPLYVGCDHVHGILECVLSRATTGKPHVRFFQSRRAPMGIFCG